MKVLALAIFLGLAASSARAAVSDYVRTETKDYNGYAGLDLISYVKAQPGDTKPGRAWIIRADLTKGYRLRTYHGDGTAENRLAVGKMAEKLYDEGEEVIVGMNGDYFDMSTNRAETSGMSVVNSRLMFPGYKTVAQTNFWFFMETGDHRLVHGKPVARDGGKLIRPQMSYEALFGELKIRHAVRTCNTNHPVIDGQVGEFGEPSQTNPRSIVGLGATAAGHEALFFFWNDGRHDDWSYGVSPEDSAQMLIDEGCRDAGELDGGGSTSFWTVNGPNAGSYYPAFNTAHGCYVNRLSADSPRAVANGLFILAPKDQPVVATIDEVNTYFDFDEALDAVAPGETIALTAPAAWTRGSSIFTSCTIASAGAPSGSPLTCSAGVPTVPAGVRTEFRDLTLVSSAQLVSVAAGGTAAVGGAVALGRLETADAEGFELAAPITAPVDVLCAAANADGDVFGFSELTVAEAVPSLAFLRHPENSLLVAEAVPGQEHATLLRWRFAVRFGSTVTAQGYNFTNGLVTVTMGEILVPLPSGTRLRLTVRDPAGRTLGRIDRPLDGIGPVVFNTTDFGALTPGANLLCEVTVVSADGQVLPGSTSVRCDLCVANETPWFSANAGDDAITGGAWLTKPALDRGTFKLTNGVTWAFVADQPVQTGHVLANARVKVMAALSETEIATQLERYRADPPRGALALMAKADGTRVWIGLTREDETVLFRELSGVEANDEKSCRCLIEADFSTDTPHVRYGVAFDDADPVYLVDAGGRDWLPSAKSANEATSRVEIDGAIRLTALDGIKTDTTTATIADRHISLKTNVVLDPSSLVDGDYTVDSAGYAFRWVDGGRTLRYDAATGRLSVSAGAPKNGLSSFLSHVLGLDPADANSVPVATIVHMTNPEGFFVSVADSVSVNPASDARVSFALETADNVKFEGSTFSDRQSSASFDIPKSATRGFYRVHIYVD